MSCLYALTLTAPPLPSRVAERLATPVYPERQPVEGFEEDNPRSIGEAYLYVDRSIANGDVPTHGNRNEHAFRFFAKMHGLGLSEDKARELFEYFLTESGGARPDPGDDKLDPMIRDIWAGKRGDATPPGSEIPQRYATDVWGPENVPEDALDPDGQKKARLRRWRPRRMSEVVLAPPVGFWDRDTDSVMPKMLEGGVKMSYGPSGHHKTGVWTSKMFDLWAGIAPPRIAYASGEGNQGLGSRFKAHCTSRGVEAKEFEGLFMSLGVPVVGNQVDIGSFNDMLSDWEFQPDIIFIDTWGTALCGEEEDNRSAAHLMSNGSVGRLAYQHRALVVLIHHTTKLPRGKGESGSPIDLEDFAWRGAQGYEDNVDAMTAIWSPYRWDMKAVQLKCTKMKDGPGGHSAYFEIKHIGTVPVPTRIGAKTYQMLTGQARFTFGNVAGALGRLGAATREKAVTSLVVTREAYPIEQGQDPEEHERMLHKLSLGLEKAAKAGSLGGLWVEENGIRWWFQTAG